MKPSDRRHALWASIALSQLSRPFSTTQRSLICFVSGQLQQIFLPDFPSKTGAGADTSCAKQCQQRSVISCLWCPKKSMIELDYGSLLITFMTGSAVIAFNKMFKRQKVARWIGVELFSNYPFTYWVCLFVIVGMTPISLVMAEHWQHIRFWRHHSFMHSCSFFILRRLPSYTVNTVNTW